MPLAVLATAFLAPLALAPHLFFYYDITPKVALLLIGAAIALALASRELDSLLAFCGTRAGRWYAAAAAASIAIAGIATLRSAHPALSWTGSNWRRYGVTTEWAAILAALWIAAYAVRARSRLLWLLRTVAAAGFLASLYGIAQYFGWDPLLPAAGYRVGEGIFQIVRPPGTLGHSDYFAAFLLWPVFAGIGLFREEGRRAWRILGAAATTAGIIAILLGGSRGSIVALAGGMCVLAAMLRPRLHVAGGVAVAVAGTLLVFYFSPAGERLRARAHWIGEERTGGARPLLWRDTLRMAEAKPLTGFGPDTFIAEFPRYQSEELARLYPDFYHESPHNIFLDALASEGVPGLLALAVLAAAGIAGGLRARSSNHLLAVALLPGFAASLIAHQFVVFTAATAFYYYLGAGVLAGAGADRIEVRRSPAVWRNAVFACGLAASAFFCVIAWRLIAADSALATVQRRLDAKDLRGAIDGYKNATQHSSAGVTANVYYSRRWASVAAEATNTVAKLYYGQVAAGAASLATQSPEQQQNAWYNLAVLAASTNDARAVEYSLRASIAAAPVWYKPHWMLARLLKAEGRSQEADHEARRAQYLNGGKDAEVAATASAILSSAATSP